MWLFTFELFNDRELYFHCNGVIGVICKREIQTVSL